MCKQFEKPARATSTTRQSAYSRRTHPATRRVVRASEYGGYENVTVDPLDTVDPPPTQDPVRRV
jgi:hypothetical protein